MAMVSKEQLRQFIKENNLKSTEDVQAVLKNLFADTLQEMLQAELETHLGYAKHDVKNKATDNSRNGHSRKTLTSEYGDVEIAVPRDRKGEFEPQIIKKHQTNTAGIEEQIIAIYARGMSTRDIRKRKIAPTLHGRGVVTLLSSMADRIWAAA